MSCLQDEVTLIEAREENEKSIQMFQESLVKAKQENDTVRVALLTKIINDSVRVHRECFNIQR